MEGRKLTTMENDMGGENGMVFPEDFPEDQVMMVGDLEEVDPDLTVTLTVTGPAKGLVDRREIEGEWGGMKYTVTETIRWRSGEIESVGSVTVGDLIKLLTAKPFWNLTSEDFELAGWDPVLCEDGDAEYSDFAWEGDPVDLDPDEVPEIRDLASQGYILDGVYEFDGLEDLRVEIAEVGFDDIIFS